MSNTYYPTPEETAQCGYCGHRGNGLDWWYDGDDAKWTECPECGCVDEYPPYLDEEDIAAENPLPYREKPCR